MAGSYVDFVTSLIYGNVLTTSHRDWLDANPNPNGLQWLAHHVDGMLVAYEAWLVAEALPPVTSWDGVRRAPWDSAQDLALEPALDGSFTGVTSVEQVGASLRDR